MGSIRETVIIEAQPARVWAVLSDFGGVAAWNPGVASATLLGSANGGVGAARRCMLTSGEKDHLDERIVGWKEGETLAVEIVGTNQPIKSGTMAFALRAEGGATAVTFSTDYVLKFGLVGKLMDAMMVQGQMRKASRSILKGLKRHIEAAPAVTLPA